MRKSNTLRNLWYNLPTKQKYIVRKLYYFPIDLWDKLTGKTNKYVPSRGSIYTGSPSGAEKFLKQGEQQLQLLTTYIDLKPTDSVLDIGSGIGRTAIALSKYLNKTGSYDGFDVVEKGVNWCNSKINKDFPNFNFKYIPLFNDLYNNNIGKAEEFKFPYQVSSFDKIFTFSVFTHMQIKEISNYFAEIHKTLKPNGKCLSTFFLYDNENEDYIANREIFNFPLKFKGYRLMNETVTSGNIAIHKTMLETMLDEHNLKIDSIIDGFWKDKLRDSTKVEYQDIVIFSKKDNR
jgi:SAM-dependent methyltransferase